MRQLTTGQFYGQTNQKLEIGGIILTDTEYTHDWVDWHYHENAYFTFILQGNVLEGNKKEVYNCTSGDLLFHNWQEPHYNRKPEGYTRGFQIEVRPEWIRQSGIALDQVQGSLKLHDPELKLLFFSLFRETKMDDITTALAIETLLLRTFATLHESHQTDRKNKPLWVGQLREILHDSYPENLLLQELSLNLGIHPVHLSRDFSKYFHCNLGDYIRKLKIEKSLILLSQKQFSLQDITFACGFSDQSHFTRSFRIMMGTTPSDYRKLYLK